MQTTEVESPAGALEVVNTEPGKWGVFINSTNRFLGAVVHEGGSYVAYPGSGSPKGFGDREAAVLHLAEVNG